MRCLMWNSQRMFPKIYNPVPAKGRQSAAGLDTAWTVVKFLYQRRDLLILIVAADYIVGYIAWAIYASNQGLGPTTAADLQYLVAGFPPLAFLILAIVFVLLLPRIVVRSEPRFYVLVIIDVVLLFAMPVLAFLSGSIEVLLFFIFVYAVVQSYAIESLRSFLSQGKPESRIWIFRVEKAVGYYLWLSSRLTIFALALATAAVYVGFVFPDLRRAYGGGAPTCNRLDIERNDVSPETLTLLFPGEQPSDEDKVVRTPNLEILLQQGGTLHIRVNKNKSAEEIVALSSATVRAVLSCED